MAGEVEVFATLSPQVVRLTGTPEQTIAAEVMVTPSEKYDFNILGHSLQTEGNVSVTIDPVNQGQKSWKVTVSNARKELGRYYEVISLKTDSAIQKEIQLRVFGNIIKDVENQAQGNGRPVKEK